MENLKCKICGGTLISMPNGDYKCDSCGTVVTKKEQKEREQTGLSESIRAAGKFMEDGNFGSAYLIYENIITKSPQDVAARWNLVLCRYGVQFQFDELTGQKLPTVNRMRYDSILEDTDYLAVLKYASEKEKMSYIRAAEAIAAIQKRYLEIAQGEASYDVFISFKAENADGTRSRDSVIGQEIYHQLTEHGLRVFYSRITLEEKGGEEFEPYIFSALNTAKVMILIGTKSEHLRSPWVVNEWQRYVALMQEKRDKNILPVYEGMALSEFPQEIPTREAVDYGAQGALQELTQGVLSITGKGVMVEAEDSRSSLIRLTEGLRQAVEQGEMNQARELADAVLDLDAENSDAYYYLLLALYKVKKATELSDVDEPWTENRYYQRALKYADPARKQLLEAVKQRRDMRIENERKSRIRKAEEERRAKEVRAAINEGKKQIDKKQYKEAFDILSKGAAGTPEGDKLIEFSKKGVEAKRLLSEKDLLNNILKKEHPDEYFRMERLETGAANSKTGSPTFWLMVLIGGALLFGLAFYLDSTVNMREDPNTILKYIWMFLGPILMVVCIVAGIGSMVVGLVNTIRTWLGQKVRREYEEHMKNVIEPLKNAAWENIKAEYVPVLGEDMFRKRPQ